MANQIPISEGGAAILRWLQTLPITPGPDAPGPLTPTERETIMAVLDMLRAARDGSMTPAGVRDLPARVVHLDRFIVDHFLPSIFHLHPPGPTDGTRDPQPVPPQPAPRPGESTETGGKAPLAEILPQHELFIMLLTQLRHSIDFPSTLLSPFEFPQSPRPENSTIRDRENHAQGGRGSSPRDAVPQPHKAPHLGRPSSWAGENRGRDASPVRGSTPSSATPQGMSPVKPDSNPAQSRSSPASGAAREAVQSAPASSQEWISRLQSIQTAASHMAAGRTAVPLAVSAAQFAVAMSKLFSQFAKLQHTLRPDSPFHASGQQAVVAASERLRAYLDNITAMMQQKPTPFTQAQIAELLQRASQEESWLASLVEFLEMQAEQTKLPQTPASRSSIHPDHPGLPRTSDTVQQPLSTTGLEKEGVLHRHETFLTPQNAAHPTQAQQRYEPTHPTPQLLHARTAPELLGMIQMHLARYPLTPVNVLIPFPVTLNLDSSVGDVEATEKAHHDPKRPTGQKSLARGTNSQIMCLIPAGPVIVGDSFDEGREDERPCYTEQLPAFLLAATPVTNAQFAAWLNNQLDTKAIVMPRPGHVYDLHGRLLARTAEAVPMSQIEMVVEQGSLSFRPQPYRENHPVVHVSWWGARAYCASNGFVLPTEEQWERGGGMVPTAYGQPIQKWRHGCKAESLSSAWANYGQNNQGKHAKENQTLPAGFFDGERVLTLAGKRVETMRAASPWGCFDMSGNVRELVDEDYDDDGLFKVTKGGSYADSSFDLRLAARLPLITGSTDPLTGFRVAFLLPTSDN